MKKKIILTILISLIAFFVFISMDQELSNDRLISLSSIQKQWLEKMEDKEILYYYDPFSQEDHRILNDVNNYIQFLSKQLNLKLIETKSISQVIESNGLIISKSDLWIEKGFSETNDISSNIFSVYSDNLSKFAVSDLLKSKIGMLSAEKALLNLDKIYSEMEFEIIETDTLEELYALYENKSVDAFILGKEYPAIFYQNELLAKRVYQINAPYSTLNIYVPNEKEILTDIFNKIISDIKLNDLTKISQIHDMVEWEKETFLSLLNEEEQEWIKNNDDLKAGIAINPPYAIQFDKKIYGVSVASLKQFEELTGVKIEYVVGNHEIMLQDYMQHDFDILLLKNNMPNLLSTNPYIRSEYVVVGINEETSITSVYDLYNYRVGMLFNNRISEGISSLLPQSEITYYEDEEDLIHRLLDQKVDLILIPRIVFDYYEQNKDLSQMDIRYTLDAKYESNFLLPQNDRVLQGLLNKSILLQDQTNMIAQALHNIPKANSTDKMIQYLIILSALVTIFFIGYFIRYLLNVSEKKKLTYLFLHDPLTNLPNKYGLSKYINKVIQKGEHGILLLLDIDNFKTINDRHGSQFGDQVLIEYSQSLLALVSENCLLGRTGGDKFLLIMKGLDEYDNDSIVSQIKTLTSDYTNSRSELHSFSVSIALAVFPKHGNTFEDLFKYLEYTLYELKERYYTNGVMEFSFDIYEKQVDEQLLIKNAKQGLLQNEFICHIQPQIHLPEGKIVGGEMLARWQHPKKGLIFPGDFIETLEKTGIIRDLDFYVLRKACNQIKEWQDDYPDLKVSVNFSPQSITSSNIIPVVKSCIDEIGFKAENLIIEVTEDIGFNSFDEPNNIFTQLKQMGIQIALDDFGKGYSSLSYIEKLSIDVLKIDKALIDNIHLKEASREIFLAITKIADIMNIPVIAEGVEYREQVEVLKTKKDIIAQGYYFSKPISIEDFNRYLQAER